VKKQPKVILICEHEPEHEAYDMTLLRKCKGTSLIECVKCYTLLEEFENAML